MKKKLYGPGKPLAVNQTEPDYYASGTINAVLILQKYAGMPFTDNSPRGILDYIAIRFNNNNNEYEVTITKGETPVITIREK